MQKWHNKLIKQALHMLNISTTHCESKPAELRLEFQLTWLTMPQLFGSKVQGQQAEAHLSSKINIIYIYTVPLIKINQYSMNLRIINFFPYQDNPQNKILCMT